MRGDRVDAELDERLSELERQHGGTVRIEDIGDVVKALMASVGDGLSPGDMEVYGELESLVTYINNAKAEIAALRPDEVKEEYLPKATDELDAIVEATAEATHNIMDATEAIEGVMETLDGEAAGKLMEATTRIYEACGFQDITGQRITKVVNALKHIEDKIEALVEAFGSEIEKFKRESPKKDDGAKPLTEDDLLHGPQLPTSAHSQAEIDALLASFE